METQHAHRVLGSCLVAFGTHKEDDQGGGHNGGKLWHSARHQLHPEETHHQPVPHICHQTLLEHASKVQNRWISSFHICVGHNVMNYWWKGDKVWLLTYNQNATFALSVSTKPTRCWCICSLLTRFQRITWFPRAPKMEFLSSTSHLDQQLRYSSVHHVKMCKGLR